MLVKANQKMTPHTLELRKLCRPGLRNPSTKHDQSLSSLGLYELESLEARSSIQALTAAINFRLTSSVLS